MTYHTPVLLKEVLTLLQPRSCGTYVDGTVGGGGHAVEILRACAPNGRLIGLDWDEEAVAASQERLKEFGERGQLIRASYVELESVLMSVGVSVVDGVLLDVGVSSRQFDESSRGFSILRDGPLDMRMNRNLPATARDVLRHSTVEELIRIFRVYGEERHSRAIANAIVRERSRQPLDTTSQLTGLIERLAGGRRGQIDPGTRVFQALRIHVNGELENLERGLAAATRCLRSGGRLAVISFHSLEDRIVKHFFQGQSRSETPTLRVITKKPVTATDEEIAR